MTLIGSCCDNIYMSNSPTCQELGVLSAEQFRALLNEYSDLQYDRYEDKISVLSRIKHQIILHPKISRVGFVDLFEFTIGSLSSKVGKQSEFLIHVLALLFKNWTTKQSMSQLYDGILKLVQQKETTVAMCLKYFTAIIQALQEEHQAQNTRQRCDHEHFFVHKILNSFLQFANIFFSKAITKNDFMPTFAFVDKEKDEDETHFNNQSEALYSLNQTGQVLLQILNLIHACLTYDFQDYKRTEEAEPDLYQYSAIILPTKYSKYSHFKQFELFMFNPSSIEMLGFAYFAVKHEKVERKVIKILGDLCRIHFRYFKNRSFHIEHIENITQVFINMISPLNLYSTKNLEKVVEFGQFLRKIIKQPIFFSINIQLVESTLEQVEKFLIETFSEPNTELNVSQWLSIIRSYSNSLINMLERADFHLPPNQETILDLFDLTILKIGARYEQFLFNNEIICENNNINFLDEGDIHSLRDILKIFRIYQPKKYKNKYKDDRYLLFILANLEHAFHLTAGGINRHKVELQNQIQNQMKNMRRYLNEFNQLLKQSQQPEPQPESEQSQLITNSSRNMPKSIIPQFQNKKLLTIIVYLSDLFVHESRVPLFPYLQQTSANPFLWTRWCLRNNEYHYLNDISSLIPSTINPNDVEVLDLKEVIMKTLPNVYKHDTIVDLVELLVKIADDSFFQTNEMKQLILGNHLECNKGENKWLILSTILRIVNQTKPLTSKITTIYDTIRDEYLQMYNTSDLKIEYEIQTIRPYILSAIIQLLKKQSSYDSNLTYIIFTKFIHIFKSSDTLLKYYIPQSIALVQKLLLIIHHHKLLYKNLLSQKYNLILGFTYDLIHKAIEEDQSMNDLIELIEMCGIHFPQILFENGIILYNLSSMLKNLKNTNIFRHSDKKQKLFFKITNLLLSKYKEIKQTEIKTSVLMNILEHLNHLLHNNDCQTIINTIESYETAMEYLYVHHHQELTQVIKEMPIYNIFANLQSKGRIWVIEKLKNEADPDRKEEDKREEQLYKIWEFAHD